MTILTSLLLTEAMGLKTKWASCKNLERQNGIDTSGRFSILGFPTVPLAPTFIWFRITLRKQLLSLAQ